MGGGGEWGQKARQYVASTPKYPKIHPYLIPSGKMAQNQWYEGEDVMDPRGVAYLFAGWGNLTLMDPLAGIRVTPCPLVDPIGNTSIMTGSCSEEFLTFMPKGMRRVSACLSTSRNALSAQSPKPKNV